MDYLIAGGAAFFVSIVSAIAGGGGALVMTPLLLLLGFPPQVILASSKGAGLGLNLGAAGKFAKTKGLINWRLAAILAVLVIAASFIGTKLVFILSTDALRHIIIGAILVMVVVIFLERKAGLTTKHVSKWRKFAGFAAYFLIAILQAGLGSGIGTLLMFVLISLFGMDTLHANATKRVAGLVLVATSFTIFAFSGYMNWLLALAMFIGMLIGGYLGARIVIKKGNKLVKNALLIVALATAISAIFFA